MSSEVFHGRASLLAGGNRYQIARGATLRGWYISITIIGYKVGTADITIVFLPSPHSAKTSPNAQVKSKSEQHGGHQTKTKHSHPIVGIEGMRIRNHDRGIKDSRRCSRSYNRSCSRSDSLSCSRSCNRILVPSKMNSWRHGDVGFFRPRKHRCGIVVYRSCSRSYSHTCSRCNIHSCSRSCIPNFVLSMILSKIPSKMNNWRHGGFGFFRACRHYGIVICRRCSRSCSHSPVPSKIPSKMDNWRHIGVGFFGASAINQGCLRGFRQVQSLA